MEGVCAVVRVITNAVNSVTLEEAGLLTGNEVGVSVGEVLMYVVPVVGIKRDQLLLVDLGIGRLLHDDAVVVARKCAGSVAGFQLSAKGNRKFKNSVGKIDYRLLESFVESDLKEIRLAVDLELVALLIFAVEMLVYLVAEGFKFDVAVLTDQL